MTVDPIETPNPYDPRPKMTSMQAGSGKFDPRPNVSALNSHLASLAEAVSTPANHPLAGLQIHAAENAPTAPMSYAPSGRVGVQGPKPDASSIPTSPTYAPTREAVAARFASSNPRSFVKRDPAQMNTAPVTFSGGGITKAMSEKQRSQIWAAGKGGQGTVNGIGTTTQAVNSITPQAYGE